MDTLDKVVELRSNIVKEAGLEASEIDATSLERMNYRLSDAIREGASVTSMADGWGQGEEACALHAAVIAAGARGYIGS